MNAYLNSKFSLKLQKSIKIKDVSAQFSVQTSNKFYEEESNNCKRLFQSNPQMSY